MTLSGVEYQFTWVDESVAAGSSVYIQVVTHPTKYTLLNWRQLQMDQERGFYRAYTSYTAGTVGDAISVFKMRADSTIESGATINKMTGPTNIDETSRTILSPLFGAEGQGNVPTTGDLAEDAAVRVIPPNTSFLIQFENDSAAASYFQSILKWWEVSADFMPEIKEV
jgi:hypothetical protein